MVLRSPSPLAPGRWHQVAAKRYHQDGLLQVDDGVRITGSSPGSLRTLSAGKEVLIGWGVGGGFVGCIKDLQLGRQAVSVHLDHDPLVLRSSKVVDCEENPCVRLPCENEGSCSVDSISGNRGGDGGFQCKCKPNFTGKTVF